MSVDTHDDTRYRIRPLKWRRHFDKGWRQEYRAETPFGGYEVVRYREDDGKWGKWRWGYCFAEYKDEAYFTCADAVEGKRLAWEHWRERLVDALDAAL